MFYKKATKIDEIFTVDLTLCSKRQIDGEDFVNFRGLLRKYELYLQMPVANSCFINKSLAFFAKLPEIDSLTGYELQITNLLNSGLMPQKNAI